jgi:hypothetical protein
VDVVLFAVAMNGEVRELAVFEVTVSCQSLLAISDSRIVYLCVTAWKSAFARVVAISIFGGGNDAVSNDGHRCRVSERKNFCFVSR